MNRTTTAGAAPGSGGLFWALVPVVLLASGVAGLAVAASIAARDPGFALEPDYYQRAVRWDQQQAEQAESARLGYRLTVELGHGSGGVELVARVLDRGGSPLRGARVEVEAFANARSSERRTLSLAESADGAYRAPLGRARPGIWELRFRVVRGDERFVEVARVELPGSAAP